jgi:hypothetical protein
MQSLPQAVIADITFYRDGNRVFKLIEATKAYAEGDAANPHARASTPA